MTDAERRIRAAYSSHKAGAKKRGLAFALTFDQWWELWAPHWHQRGVRVGCKQMCRTRDEGGYTPGNVRIDTVTANQHERLLCMRVKTAHRAFRSTRRASIEPSAEWICRKPVDPFDGETLDMEEEAA